MTVTDTQKHAIFKTLASKSQYATGLEFGFDKHYKSNTAIINAVNKIYRQVKENPERYAVNPDMIDMVEKGMASRKTMGIAAVVEPGKSASEQSLDKLDTKDLVLGAKKKAWVLMHRKLDHLSKNRSAFNKESLMSIAKVAGITFDKGQLASGGATDLIGIKAHVDTNMSVEEMLKMMIGMKRAAEDTDGE